MKLTHPSGFTVAALLAAGAMNATHAGFFSTDFNSGLPAGAALAGSAFVDSAGGAGGSGALKLTVNTNFLMGSMVIDSLDNPVPITGFTATFKMLIGGGTMADGLSFNFAGDLPDFTPFGEEGAGNGLTISFDTYDNSGGEAPAIEVKFRGTVIFRKLGNPELFRTGDYVDVRVHADPDGTLDLAINGTPVVTDLVAAFSPSPGRFGFGARTGGSTDNHFIDDLRIETTTRPAERPFVLFANPRGGGTSPETFVNLLLQNGTRAAVKEGSVSVTLDGHAVAANVIHTNPVTIVFFDPPGALPSASDHTVAVTFTDTGTPPETKTVSFNFQTAYYRGPDGTLYQVVWTPWGTTWGEAFNHAQQTRFLQRFGRLVTIESAAEDALVERVRRTSFPGKNIEEVWAGGLQRATPALPHERWFWITGQPFPGRNGEGTYANWLPNEPNDFFGFDSENFLTIGLAGQFGWNDNGNFGSTRLQGFMAEYQPFFIWVDVRPNDLANKVNLNSNGQIPVAIMGTNHVDVTKLTSITAGRVGNEAKPASTSFEDVNGDGFTDLLMQFHTRDLDLRCGDGFLVVVADDANGSPFRGGDRIEPLDCPPYALGMTALQDVSGRTEIGLTVNTVQPGYFAPTLADHLLLKSYDLSGRLRWTANFQNVPLLHAPNNSTLGKVWVDGVVRGQPIHGQAQVANSKNGRAEVLRGETKVLLRPDLAVTSVQAPRQVNVRQQVPVVAEIAELNGDLGASFSAFLFEGGTLLDAAMNLKLEPRKSAAVVFTLNLPTPGIHNLSVVVSNMTPSDFDWSNNQQAFAVEAVQPALEPVFTQLFYSHNVSEGLYIEENEFTVFRRTYSNTGENFFQALFIPGLLRFPVSSAAIAISVDGVLKAQLEAGNIPVTSIFTNDCFIRLMGFAQMDPSTMIQVQVDADHCFGFQQSFVTVSRFAFENTFFSAEYSRITGEPIWESSGQFGQGTFLLPSGNLSTRFVVTDDIGAFGGNAAISSFFDSFWRSDFDFMTPWGSHVSGFDSSLMKNGNNFQLTEP